MFVALVVVWLGLLLALPPRPSPWLVLVSGLPVLLAASWLLARRRGASWRQFARDTADGHALGVVLLYAVGVQLADAHGITTDGVTYFSQLRSLVFDRDLDVTREFALLNQPARPNHVVPVGPLLLWAPLYLAVAVVDAIGRGVGLWPAPEDLSTLGLGLPYVRAALLSSFAIGAVGLFAVRHVLRRRFMPLVTFVSVLLLFGATPLYWYMVYEPSMTHASSFGFVALFIVCAAEWFAPSPGAAAVLPVAPESPAFRRHAFLLGSILGWAFLARSQEAVFAIYPGLLVLTAAGLSPAVRGRAALRLAGWALLGALPWIVLQLGHSYVMFSRYEYQLMGEGGYFNPWRSRWLDTLFSSWHGFLSWTPVAYLAVVGTFAYLRREWRWAAAALLIVFATAWVNGATQDWAGGWSFGGRRFSSALVMLAPGLALLIEAGLRRPAVVLAPLVVAALWWNHLLMVQYTAGLIPKNEPVSFGRLVRQQAELHTRSPYWYPFAFPANVWFAWREGVPVDKYDVLSPETPGPRVDITFDRTAEKYLLSGWDVPGGDDWGPSWWIGGTTAVLAVPFVPGDAEVQVTVKSRTRFEEPAMQATLALEINGVEVGRFTAGVPDASEATLTIPADLVSRTLRAGFNLVGLRQVELTRVDPADPRPPGPLASRQGRAVWPVAIYRLQIH